MNISGTREDIKKRKTPLNEFRKKAEDLSNSLLASELKVCDLHRTHVMLLVI